MSNYHTPHDRISFFLLGAAATASLVWLYHSFPTTTSTSSSNKATSRSIVSGDNDQDKENTSSPSTTTTTPEEPLFDAPDLDLRLLRKAEAVIQHRTTALTIVVERCTNDHNHSAILRTAEALGVQNVVIVDPPKSSNDNATPNGKIQNSDTRKRPLLPQTADEQEQKALHHLFAQNATEWLTLTEYSTTHECVQALRESGHAIWVTSLGQDAVPLTEMALAQAQATTTQSTFPDKLAIVFGTEAVGCSQEMLNAADLKVYLPLYGFADSLNLSVATALVVHHILSHLQPAYIGHATEAQRTAWRRAWFQKLGQQRVYSNKEKREYKRLQTELDKCTILLAKQTRGEELKKEQLTKLAQLPDVQAQWDALQETRRVKEEALAAALETYVQHPPAPLTDLRRPDVHRVTYVGKSTKKQNQEHWQGMPALSHPDTTPNLTASFFKQQLAGSRS